MSDSRLHIEERQTNGVTILFLAGEMLLDDGDLAAAAQVGVADNPLPCDELRRRHRIHDTASHTLDPDGFEPAHY